MKRIHITRGSDGLPRLTAAMRRQEAAVAQRGFRPEDFREIPPIGGRRLVPAGDFLQRMRNPRLEVYLDPDVFQWIRSLGPRAQAMVNRALRAAMKSSRK
ncbi:MAG: BrnA antitoxin family protein [Terriglobales bacterium]